MQASIIVLVHGQLPLTRRCVASVLACTRDVDYELIVVDNGSPNDGTAGYLRDLKRQHAHVYVYALKKNRGYAAGNNVGIQASRGNHVVLLNNDTVVTPGWLARMVAVAESDPAIGAVGPLSNNVSGVQMYGDNHYMTLTRLPLWASAVAVYHAGQIQPVDAPHRLVGFCILFTREVIQRIGLLDERFGMGNFEDDDYALRLRLAHYRQVIARDVWVHHEGSATFKALKIDYQKLIDENKAKFIAKWEKTGG